MRLSKVLAVLCCALASLALPAAAQSTFPPTPLAKLAVNPLTNKVYMANTADNTVTAFNAATGASKTIAVGPRPSFIAVNPVTNRVYVNNASDSTLSVIDGAADTLLGTHAIGSTGPITVNPVTNVIYVVRLTGTGSDEVTFFDGNTNTWYTIATASFQPNAMAVNPVTDKIYVAHYATGDVRIISGVYNANDFFPATVSVGVYSHPFAIAVNPVTNKVYVITQDSRGPIAVIDGASNTGMNPAVATGHGQNPKAIAVNPVTNKVYAAFASEVIVIDGATNALTYVPIGGVNSGAVSLGIDYTANRIFVASDAGTLTVIDGDSNTVASTSSVAAGTSSIGVNPVTGTRYFFDTTLQSIGAAAGETPHAIPLTTSITPFANDTATSSGTLTMSASSAFSPAALPVRKVYYQFDSRNGPWLAASGSGPFTASFSNLAPGSHTVHAFAVDGQDAPLATGSQSIPLVGSIASYSFTVPSPKVDPTVSLASSANPSAFGQSVTFTASVSGSAGTATGTVTFRDGTSTLCAAVTLASGTATCATSALASGTHSITAGYSGDGQYNARTSGAVSQTVSAPKSAASVSLASSANPSTTGQAVTFTATVSGSAGTPTGTVAFTAGGTSLSGCGAVALAGGAASCTTSGLAAGSYTIAASYSGSASYNGASGTLTQVVSAPPAPPPPTATPRLGNIATRGQVLTGNDVMIGGFVIGGSGNKTIVVRARGPSLAAAGISNPLANPTLRLVRSSDQATIATNDDWGSAPNAGALSASGFAPSDAMESAILVSLPSGAYTAIVAGAGGGTGVGIVEVFEVDHPEIPLANIATRGPVLTGNDVMIGGFVIQGDGPRTVVIRAGGPSLAAFGIANPLANPTLELVRSSDQAVIASNDDWRTAANAAQVSASGFAPSNDLESAILVTLQPGAYTAIVRGAGGGTGVGIVEVFAQ